MLDTSLWKQAFDWHEGGKPIAVALVIDTWKSAPRPLGARLFARADGLFEGSVSGGCVEGEVIAAAREVLDEQRPQVLEFGIDDETAWNTGLSCGGRIKVLVHPLSDSHVDAAKALLAAAERRTGGVLLTRLSDGAPAFLGADGTQPDLPESLLDAARDAWQADRPPALDEDGAWFIEPLRLPPRLIIVGATHITQALLPLAAELNYPCIVVDPRTAFAAPERLADVHRDWPDRVLPTLDIGPNDAVLMLTHDPKIDDPALHIALAAQPFYIGALGSTRTHAKRLARLAEQGLDPEDVKSRLHAPIGLPIGARTATEIALSALAEVVQAYRAMRPL